MYTVTGVTDDEVTDFLFNDYHLCNLALNDNELNEWLLKGHCALEGEFIAIRDNDDIVAIFRHEPYTDITIKGHLYVSSVLHGTGASLEMTKLLLAFIKERTPLKKVILPTPGSCIHAKKACERNGAFLEATIKNCLYWRGELTDLNFYTFEV